MPVSMNIGEAAQAAGVSTKMIRHYEQIGLLPPASRSEAGYRRYGERDVSVLRFIRQSRKLGFSMEQIAELLGLWSDDRRASREVKALAQQHLQALEQKMQELAQMQVALTRLVATCHGDDDPDCPILAELAVSSPQAPEHGLKLSKRARAPAVRAPDRAPAQAAADLMAWTRHFHSSPH